MSNRQADLKRMLLTPLPYKPEVVDTAYGWPDRAEIYVTREITSDEQLQIEEWWTGLTKRSYSRFVFIVCKGGSWN